MRIGSVEGMVYFFLRYLAGFDERFPGIRVSVPIVGSCAVRELLRDGGPTRGLPDITFQIRSPIDVIALKTKTSLTQSLITMPSYQPSPAARKLLQTFKAGMGRYGTTAAERG